MNATVKTAQMGLAEGEVVKVVSRGVRSCVVRGNSQEISVTVPTEDLVFEGEDDGPPAPVENVAPYDLETDPAVRDADGNVVMQDSGEEPTSEVLPDSGDEELPETIGGEVTSEVESADADMDEELPERTCTDEEGCTSCQ